MHQSRFGADWDRSLQVLWTDGERVFYRSSRDRRDGDQLPVLIVRLASEHPTQLRKEHREKNPSAIA
jgi:hypothetical protein